MHISEEESKHNSGAIDGRQYISIYSGQILQKPLEYKPGDELDNKFAAQEWIIKHGKNQIRQ